jgi:hypothetical protein
MKPGNTLWGRLVPVLLAGLLLASCAGAPRQALFFDEKAWEPDIRSIALVELSFDRQYSPPVEFDLEGELRSVLGRELAQKGYRMIGAVAFSGTRSDAEPGAAQLAEQAPEGIDAALAVHVDFWFMSVNWGERNPPPEVEFDAEARLVSKRSGRELWRDRGEGRAGGAGGWALGHPLAKRHEALQMLAERLFDTLPDAGRSSAEY